MTLYYLHYVEEKEYEPYGVTYAPDDTDLFIFPPSGEFVAEWSCLKFTLKEGDFADYLTNDLGVRLCSEKLRKIIEGMLSTEDRIQFLESIVINDQNEVRVYSILHFPVNFQIINKDKSIMAGPDVVVKPVLKKDAITHLNIFTLPNEDGRTTFVSKSLKEAIEANHCSGLTFSKVSVI